MPKKSLYKWYALDIVVFLSINLWVFKYFDLPTNVIVLFSPWTLIIFALGVWRLTDIITHESVTDIIRAPFKDLSGKDIEEGILGFFASLFSCNACMGVWMSMISFYLFLGWPSAMTAFMIVMALTGLERFYSKIYNFLEKRG